MAIVGDSAERDRGDQDASKRPTELLELSLQGKWISLARNYIEKNAPCELETYLVELAPMMPTHIKCNQSGGRLNQLSLARDALRKLNTLIVDGVIQPLSPRKKHSLYDHDAMLREFRQEDGNIKIPSKGRYDARLHAFETWLRRRAKCVGNRIFIMDERRKDKIS